MIVFQILGVTQKRGEHDGDEKIGWNATHEGHGEKADEGPSVLDILRYMGGLVVFIFMIPGFFMMCKKRKEAQAMIEGLFQDWVSDGTLVKVTYYPGSKHAQPQVVLTVPPEQLPVVATVVIQGSEPIVPALPKTQTVTAASVMPMPTPKYPDV